MELIYHLIVFAIGWVIGWAIMKSYTNHNLRQRYFYVSYYTTKQVDNQIKIIYGGTTIMTDCGLYLNEREVKKLIAKDIKNVDDIIILGITELKRKDYIRFTN